MGSKIKDFQFEILKSAIFWLFSTEKERNFLLATMLPTGV